MFKFLYYKLFLIQFEINILELISLTIQSIPSSKPSPFLALQGIILIKKRNTPNVYFQDLLILKILLFNFQLKPLQCPKNDKFKTCLLQNINKVAPISFSYFKSECNSYLQS